MADVTINPLNVEITTDSSEDKVLLKDGEISPGTDYSDAVAGEICSKSLGDDGTYARGNATHVTMSTIEGIFVTNAAIGGYARIIRSGRLKVGSGALVTGTVYVAGTDGAIKPVSDSTTGDYVTVLGIAEDTETLNVNIINSGILLS